MFFKFFVMNLITKVLENLVIYKIKCEKNFGIIIFGYYYMVHGQKFKKYLKILLFFARGAIFTLIRTPNATKLNLHDVFLTDKLIKCNFKSSNWIVYG